MKITYKDLIATLLVAAIVVPYLGFLAWGQVPLIQDARGMTGAGLLLGLGAAAVAGRAAFRRDVDHRTALGSGIVALLLGVTAVWAETSAVLLGFFMVAIVVTWALGEYAAHHTGVDTGRPMARTS